MMARRTLIDPALSDSTPPFGTLRAPPMTNVRLPKSTTQGDCTCIALVTHGSPVQRLSGSAHDTACAAGVSAMQNAPIARVQADASARPNPAAGRRFEAVVYRLSAAPMVPPSLPSLSA